MCMHNCSLNTADDKIRLFTKGVFAFPHFSVSQPFSFLLTENPETFQNATDRPQIPTL